jgi:hypothetical protein
MEAAHRKLRGFSFVRKIRCLNIAQTDKRKGENREDFPIEA